jgi:hypothetical protein
MKSEYSEGVLSLRLEELASHLIRSMLSGIDFEVKALFYIDLQEIWILRRRLA